jgi:hypothetical protein
MSGRNEGVFMAIVVRRGAANRDGFAPWEKLVYIAEQGNPTKPSNERIRREEKKTICQTKGTDQGAAGNKIGRRLEASGRYLTR